MRRAAKCFINHIKNERNLSQRTVTTYQKDLGLFIGFVQKRYRRDLLPGQIAPDMIQAYLEFLAHEGHTKRNQPLSRARRLTALRSWFKYLQQAGLVRDDPSIRVRCPKVRHREPSFLTVEDCRRLSVAAGRHRGQFLALRNQAIVATFLMTGLRLAELIGLNLRDVSLPKRSLRVVRKGQEEHSVPASEELVRILRPYMRARRQRAESRALFISLNNSRIGRSTIWHLIRNCVRQAGIRRRVSPHTLRHSFASALLIQGENLQTIRALLNHKSIATTSQYLHLINKELHHAVNRLDFSEKP